MLQPRVELEGPAEVIMPFLSKYDGSLDRSNECQKSVRGASLNEEYLKSTPFKSEISISTQYAQIQNVKDVFDYHTFGWFARK
jgi:hypothetical protein